MIDPGADGQNHHAVKSIIDKMDSLDVPGLQHVILFFPHESLPSLYNVQDLCSQEIDHHNNALPLYKCLTNEIDTPRIG